MRSQHLLGNACCPSGSSGPSEITYRFSASLGRNLDQRTYLHHRDTENSVCPEHLTFCTVLRLTKVVRHNLRDNMLHPGDGKMGSLQLLLSRSSLFKCTHMCAHLYLYWHTSTHTDTHAHTLTYMHTHWHTCWDH